MDAPTADLAARLQALADVLRDLGWTARLVSPRSRPKFLFVQNPAPGLQALHTFVRFSAEDGFFWARTESLAGDAAEAAAIITGVLSPGER
jgi:hypothetical protein